MSANCFDHSPTDHSPALFLDRYGRYSRCATLNIPDSRAVEGGGVVSWGNGHDLPNHFTALSLLKESPTVGVAYFGAAPPGDSWWWYSWQTRQSFWPPYLSADSLLQSAH